MMSDVNIKVMDKGPLFVSGDVEVVDAEGNRFESKDKFALCRCGLSNNKPFCDGTHSGDFEDCARAEKVV
jgi:CDGSH-type Zn-finger protein